MSGLGVTHLRKPIYLRQRSSEWYTTTTVGVGLFTDSFLYSVIIPILPYSLQEQYGVSRDDVQFWTSAMIISYGGAILVASPVIGLIAERTKARRLPYLFSLLVLLAATLMLYLGKHVMVVVLARIFQGVSAAVVWIVGLVLLVDSVGHQNISRAVGFAVLGSSSAILIGPLVGGVLYDQLGQLGITCICLALICINFLMRLFVVEKHVAETWAGSDEPQKTNLDPEADVGHVPQQSNHQPLGSSFVSLFLCRRLLCAMFSTLISAILISTFDAVIPLFARHTLGLSPTATGLVFSAVIIPGLVSPFIGWLCDRHGPRWIVSSGYMLLLPILLSLRFVEDDELPQLVLFCGLLSGIGICYSMVNVPIVSEYTQVVAQRQTKDLDSFGGKGGYAQAYGVYNIVYSIGMLVGPLWGGLMMEKYDWAIMTTSLAVACSLTGVVTALWCGDSRGCCLERKAGKGKETIV